MGGQNVFFWKPSLRSIEFSKSCESLKKRLRQIVVVLSLQESLDPSPVSMSQFQDEFFAHIWSYSTALNLQAFQYHETGQVFFPGHDCVGRQNDYYTPLPIHWIDQNCPPNLPHHVDGPLGFGSQPLRGGKNYIILLILNRKDSFLQQLSLRCQTDDDTLQSCKQ